MNSLSGGDLAAWLGSIFGLVGVVAAIVIYFLQRRAKRLTYRIVQNSDLLTKQGGAATQLSVTHNSHNLTSPRLVAVSFTNNGNAEIRPNDFTEPLTISFEADTSIQAFSIVATKPSSLTVALTLIDAQNIAVDSLLLNADDEFTVELIVDGPATKIGVASRIAGIKEISNVGPSDVPKRFPRRASIVAGIVVGLPAFFLINAFAAVLAIEVTGIGYQDSDDYYSSDGSSTSSDSPTPEEAEGALPSDVSCGDFSSRVIEEVPLADAGRREIGKLQLVKSDKCQTAWAALNLQDQLLITYTLTITRPSDGSVLVSTRKLTGDTQDYRSVYDSPMLGVQTDCVSASVALDFGKGKVETAKTKCRG